jgi:hypothetical protein
MSTLNDKTGDIGEGIGDLSIGEKNVDKIEVSKTIWKETSLTATMTRRWVLTSLIGR